MIKTFDQLFGWCERVGELAGSPSAACGHAFILYRPVSIGTEDPRLSCSMDDETECLMVDLEPYATRAEQLPIPIRMGECEVRDEGVIAYGLHPIIPGLWALQPSLNVPGLLHVFVTIYGVPDPAPWEKRIVIAPGYVSAHHDTRK